jgi:hypothetical protein
LLARINTTSLALMMPSGAVHPIIPGGAKAPNPESSLVGSTGFRVPACGRPRKDAGKLAEVPMGEDHLSEADEPASPARAAATEPRAPTRRHPLFGALKGLLRVTPGIDLTRPTWDDWDTVDR